MQTLCDTCAKQTTCNNYRSIWHQPKLKLVLCENHEPKKEKK